MMKKIGLGILIVFIGIQFVSSNRETGEVILGIDFIELTNPPASVVEVLKSSCYDCHSNQTNYPWYSQVAPLSWWIDHHIEEGRDELNFSEWGTYSIKRKTKKLHEIIEEVEENEMPLESYLWIHSESKLSPEQVTELLDWIKYLEIANK